MATVESLDETVVRDLECPAEGREEPPQLTDEWTADEYVDACAAAARVAGVGWLLYEHDEPSDPAASLEHGARTLAELRE